MRRIPWAAAGAALVSTLGFAEDAVQSHDLRAPDRWAADEVVTRDVREESDIWHTLVRKGGANAPQKSHRSLHAGFVRRCLEASDDGALRRSLVRFDAWSVDFGPVADASLVGTLVETSPLGWSIVAADRNPSSHARTWLDAHFGAKAADFGLAATGATEPLAVGAAWAGPSAPLARWVAAQEDAAVVPDAAKWKFRLAAADATDAGTAARVEFSGLSPLEGIPLPTAWSDSLQWDKGSAIDVSGHAAGVPGAWHRTGRIEAKTKLDLRTTMDSDVKFVVTGKVRAEDVRSAGGARPEFPKIDPAAGPVVRIASPWQVGTRITETGRDESASTETPLDDEGKPGTTPAAETTVVTWTATLACDAVDAAGAPERMTVTFAKWSSRTGDATADTSLEGAVLDVTREGWKFRSGASASAAAWTWMNTRFARGSGVEDALRGVVTPLMPVAAKQEWRLDEIDAIAPLRPRIDLPMDPGRAQASATLERVDGEGAAARAVISYRISAPISCVAGCSGANPLTGGTYAVRGTTSGAAGDWLVAGVLDEEQTLMVPLENVRLDVTVKRHVDRAPAPAQQ